MRSFITNSINHCSHNKKSILLNCNQMKRKIKIERWSIIIMIIKTSCHFKKIIDIFRPNACKKIIKSTIRELQLKSL